MQILKIKFVDNYLIPILKILGLCLIIPVYSSFIFQSGRYFGTFIRGLYELVLKNV